MKKTYIKPEIAVVEISPAQLLSGSNTSLSLSIDEDTEADASEQM